MRKNDIVIELVLGCERGGRMKRKALYLDDSEKELDALFERYLEKQKAKSDTVDNTDTKIKDTLKHV